MKRIMKTTKEDYIWLNERDSFEETQQAIETCIHNYNHLYPRSILNELSSTEF